MTPTVPFAEAQADLDALWERVLSTREAVVIRRGGAEDVALLPASELDALLETAHLLRSPRNADRLLAALVRARDGVGGPSTVEALRKEAGLE